MPKILAISDLHGHLPEIEPCDLLLIGGDVCRIDDDHSIPVQNEWLFGDFSDWLKDIPAKHVVGIAGNHDFALEDDGIGEALPWHYLEDSEVELEGLRIYGTPWVPNLQRWAFHRGMNSLCHDWAYIPQGVDILLSHGPPYGYGDNVPGTGPVGCLGMRDALRRIQPRVFISGHIHEGWGRYNSPWVSGGIWNVSHMDEFYDPIHEAVEIVLD